MTGMMRVRIILSKEINTEHCTHSRVSRHGARRLV